jgi:hypothetical protein
MILALGILLLLLAVRPRVRHWPSNRRDLTMLKSYWEKTHREDTFPFG